MILPLANPDGRARVADIDTVWGMNFETLRHYTQGRWKDGTLCGWPGCKIIHPMPKDVSFLGAYFNDDGINLMHDNFFLPMAEETKVLLSLADNYAPDGILLLHGGTNTINSLLPTAYMDIKAHNKLMEISRAVFEECSKNDLNYVCIEEENRPENAPPSFNLTSALHHICGGVCGVYESNQGLAIPDSLCCTYEEILKVHYILFSETIKAFL